MVRGTDTDHTLDINLSMVGDHLLGLIAQDKHVIFQGDEVQILVKYLEENRSLVRYPQ